MDQESLRLAAIGAVLGATLYHGTMVLSSFASRRLSTRYPKFSAEQRALWDVRLPSTLHALAVAGSATYMYYFSRELSGSEGDVEPLIFKRTWLSTATLAFSLGYFLVDLVMLRVHRPYFGGVEMVVHHIMGIASLVVGLWWGEAHGLTLGMLVTEFTTPFVNLRWMLEAAGMRDSSLYVSNGMGLLLSWTLIRILYFAEFFPFLYHTRHELALVRRPTAALCVGVPAVIFCMNLMWYHKIVRGALKLLWGSTAKDGDAPKPGVPRRKLISARTFGRLVQNLRQRV